MKSKLGILWTIPLALGLAVAAQAQVAVAVGDASRGVLRAAEKTSVAGIRTAAYVAVAIPRVAASSAVMGVATGVAITASSIAVGTAEIGAKAGASMLLPVAGAATDVSLGLLKAGWHTVWGKRRAPSEH